VILLADADNLEVSGASPLGRAVLDVQRDFYAVLGYAPVVFNLPPAPGSLVPGTVVITFGTAQSAPWMADLPTSQCYTVSKAQGGGAEQEQHALRCGADVAHQNGLHIPPPPTHTRPRRPL
jgi:hypothetical protein